MIKVITVTVFRSFNYGAVLQAYALQKKLNDLGYDCQVLNYRPPQKEKRFINVFQKPNSLKELIINTLPIFKYKESKRMISAANRFLSNNFKLTNSYLTYEEIIQNPPEADIYICGSDQIWNPIIHGKADPYYFLDFVKDDKKIKASFAASIGENYIDNKYNEQIKNFLDSFDCISVRENKAKEVLSKITDKAIKVIADPVFLLNKKEWISKSTYIKLKNKYILCYFLYQPKYLSKFLKKLKKQTGYDIISVTNNAYSKIYKDKLIRDVGPDGLLGLIVNAEMVITSSFHGTAFSILLEKQFYSVVSPERGSRITDILNKLNLSDRIITEHEQFIFDKVDYRSVSKNVAEIRNESLAYINEIITLSRSKSFESN